MNSKWQISKVGLVNFWYYDEEEFPFLDGRMLLRGANGSGKSVTMQSFIPLLLDGNMRPERLDPFGSRARKMENYLLEEEDGREERTGYLYMEMKRLESDSYVTIGIGMRARKNKKMESWYFCITDGRRIGKDFFLYKDVQSKLPYTKIELRNRIGNGGQVLETQGEYAQCVNKLLFGFETMEEYRELLELLIQLRTPKLSKDFKPTIINEILSNSLQTLSEDDLRPMSEAIENMDSLKTNLDMLNDSIRAAKQIERVYDQYNQIVLYDKALLFTRELKTLAELTEKSASLTGKIESSSQELRKEEERYESLKQEEAVLQEEKASLADSDAARLKEQEERLSREEQNLQKDRTEKERQESEKKEKRLEAEEKRRRQQEQCEVLADGMNETLDEMEEILGEIPFDEFSFLKKELTDSPEEFSSFDSHEQLLRAYTKKVQDGKAVLEEERLSQEKYERFLEELDGCRKEQDQAERELRQYENLLQETKEELTEKIYQWEKSNQELRLKAETLQELSRNIADYQMGTDYEESVKAVREEFYLRENTLRADKSACERSLAEAKEQLSEAEKELSEWEEKKDPEPEQPEAVQKNRKLLREKGIPYLQFYKTVDFGDTLSPEQASRLEEALGEMGILDALIVPAEYREQVLALDQGVLDKYIFSDAAHVKENLQAVLEVDNGENDILFYQQVSRALGAIGTGRGEEIREKGAVSDTWVDERGIYRLGILEGTVTGEYEARFIGAKARERFRAQQIEAFEKLCETCRELVRQRESELNRAEGRIRKLEEERLSFPSGQDLKVAAREYSQKEYALGLIRTRLAAQQERTEAERARLEEIRIHARKVCAACYLPMRLDVFTAAVESLAEYKDALTGLRISHEKYLGGLRYVRSQEEYLEELDRDLDDILYDLNRTQGKLRETERALQSVREQLQLTDYEKIKERLDSCIRRLAEIPDERDESVQRKARLAETIRHAREDLEHNEQQRQREKSRRDWLEGAFRAEYALGYTERSFAATEDAEDQAEKVCQMFAGKFGNRKQTDLLGSLQEVYHQNKAYLTEYHMTMQTLFSEQDEESAFFELSMKRIDILVKYRGNTLKFKELILRLCEDAEEQKRLLSDKDRELFEDILANTISKKIRLKIQSSKRWVEKMNSLMESMRTSSGLTLSLRWKSRRAEREEQLDTRTLVELLQKDSEIMREEEVEKLSLHFRSKIEEARKLSSDGSSVQSFHMIMREVLDYRKWFEFQLECQKTGEKKKELTDRVFFTFSGGEKAMAMYVPLFSAVVAKYSGARQEAPRLISLDEAFAGVDEMNIRDMFRLMVEFDFNFMINSQILWGDYDTVPSLAIYQLVRPENARYVTVIPYVWNGRVRSLAMDPEEKTEGAGKER